MKKIARIIPVILITLLSATVDSVTYAGLPECKSIDGPNLPDGFVSLGGSIIGTVDSVEYGLEHVCKGRSHELWLQRVSSRDQEGHATWTTIAKLAVPALGNSEILAFGHWCTCKRDSVADPSIVGVAKRADGPLLTNIVQAWRADGPGQRFEQISVVGIQCQNDAGTQTTTDLFWIADDRPQGMLAGALIYADGSASPGNQGLWISYGAFDMSEEYFGSTEFWLSYREGDGQSLMSAGASVLPMTFRHGRLGWGPFLNAGFEERKGGGRSVLAGVLGAGAEFIIRLSDHWDLAPSAEVDYLTTVDSEFQFRLALRYHDMRISAWKKP